MPNDTLQLTNQKVLHYTEELLEAHLPLAADGYCCTTADLVDVLLAVRFVLPEEDTVRVLDDLLRQVRETLRIRVKILFLDRGFDGTAVMAYLTRLRQPTVIACTIRGKTGGTRALCQGHRTVLFLGSLIPPGGRPILPVGN